MKCWATPAPVINPLRPCITHLAPFLVAVVSIIVGSEPEPGAGSVITMDERTLPSTMGCSQRAFCASVATWFNERMLPSSGAAQLNTAGSDNELFHLS